MSCRSRGTRTSECSQGVEAKQSAKKAPRRRPLKGPCRCTSVPSVFCVQFKELIDERQSHAFIIEIHSGVLKIGSFLLLVLTIVTHGPCWRSHRERERCSAVSHTGHCIPTLSLPPFQLLRHSRDCTRPPPSPRLLSFQLSPPRSRTQRALGHGHAHQLFPVLPKIHRAPMPELRLATHPCHCAGAEPSCEVN